MIDPNLDGKNVLVTGSNTGIGKATAHAFAEQGANVIVHYLARKPEIEGPFEVEIGFTSEEEAEAIKDELVRLGVRAVCLAADLSNPNQIVPLFNQAEQNLGSIDILVNNAAHCELPDTIFETTATNIERHFAVNTRSAVLLIAEFAKRKKDRGDDWGRVINISTDAARMFPTQISYGASKAALEAYTRSIAYEVSSLGITVNTIAPGPVQTGWMSKELVEEIKPHIPLGRVGRPGDIANAIVFLASTQADWLTGQIIKVSGGHNI